MTRSTAMRVRMDLALPVDAGDFSSVGKAAKKLETLKETAKELGFSLTTDVAARVGSFDFGDSGAPEGPEGPESPASE